MQSNILLEKHAGKVDYVVISRPCKAILFLKRIIDIVISFFGLIFISPLFLIVAILVKTDSKGPVFFMQTRIGKNCKTFKIIKFRTMVVDAESKGLSISTSCDTRITRIGALLRKYKIDELPQLINVLVGNMSLVGPRPEVPKYVSMYDNYQKQVLVIKPGITDYASINFINENEILATAEEPEKLYIEGIMPEKIGLNIIYINELSIIKDVIIILRTLVKVLSTSRK